MRRGSIALMLALCTLPARGASDPTRVDLDYTLTQIDSAPTFDEIRGSNFDAPSAFDAVVNTILTTPDPGVKLRAIRALPEFCPDPVRHLTACAGLAPHLQVTSLLGMWLVPEAPAHSRGIPLLTLRTTMEALGAMRSEDPDDVGRLSPYLNDPARDLRTAAARSLALLCPSDATARSTAVMLIRTRLQQEQIEQVRLVLSKALRDLQACAGSPPKQ